MRRRRARETSEERQARLRRVRDQRSSRLHRETSEERNARVNMIIFIVPDVPHWCTCFLKTIRFLVKNYGMGMCVI